MLVQVALRGRVGITGDGGEDVGPVRGAHRRADLVGRSVERGLAARREQQHLVAHVQIGEGVRDDQDDAAGVGELTQHRHDLPVERGVQPGGRLVEDQQRRAGQQFQRHRGALALAAGEFVDAGVEMFGHLEFLEHLVDDLFPVGLRGVRRQPQLRGVHQRLAHGELAVHDVVLRHHPDPGAQRGVLGVHVVAFERHLARRRMRVAGDQAGEGRLTRAGRADHRGQGARPRRDRDVVQQRLVVLDRPCHAVHFQAAGRRGGGGLGAPDQCAVPEDQVNVADGDRVAVGEQLRLDAGAVDERAVDAAVVADLGAGARRDQGRVVTGGQHVGDDDVVVAGAADLHRTRRYLRRPAGTQDLEHAGGDVAVTAGAGRRGGPHLGDRLHRRRRDRLLLYGARRRRWRGIAGAWSGGRVGPPAGWTSRWWPRVGGRLARPLPAGAARDWDGRGRGWGARRALMLAHLEGQQRAVGITDVDLGAVVDVDDGHPPAVDEHPVERAVVDREPAALVEAQHEVCAGDQRMGDADIGAQVPADDHVVAGCESAGGPVITHGQRRRCRSGHRAAPAATIDIARNSIGWPRSSSTSRDPVGDLWPGRYLAVPHPCARHARRVHHEMSCE